MPESLSSIIQSVVKEIPSERPTIPDVIPFSGDHVRNTLKHSMDKDPDRMVDVHDIANARGASPDIVDQNLNEIKKQERLQSFDPAKNPALAEFLTNTQNADVSHDDIDTLSAIEDHFGAFVGGALSFPEMAVGGTGALIEAGGRTVERVLPEFISRPIREFEESLGIEGFAPSEILGAGAEAIGEVGEKLAPEEETFTTQVAGGLGQAAAQISLMLTAPHLAAPSLFGMGVEQQAERQREAGTEGQDIVSDLALVAGGGITAVVEKFGLEKLLNRVPPSIQNAIGQKLADVAIGGGYEALTEVAENIGHGLIEKLTTNPDADIFKGIQQEATVAGTVGAIIRTLVPSYRGNAKSKEKVSVVDNILISAGEQDFIDTALTLAQESKTGQRSEKAFSEFTKGLPANTEFRIAPEAFEGMDIPDYIAEQIDGLGSDVKVTLDQLTKDFVNDPTIMEAVRPHMKMREESFTQSEMEAGLGVDSVKNLIEAAQAEVDLKTEADAIYDEVVSQLVATGRMSETMAKQSAVIVPAYVTVKAKETGLSVREVYDMMGLKIEKKAPVKVDFGEETIEQEFTVEETGQKAKVREMKQVVYDRTVKRRDMVAKLRDCLNG